MNPTFQDSKIPAVSARPVWNLGILPRFLLRPDRRYGARLLSRGRAPGLATEVTHVPFDRTLSGGAGKDVEPTPAERSLRARAAAYRLHSLYDSRDLTANARTAFQDRFARQVDPSGTLPEAERQRRAECARKAYFAALAARSAQTRRARRVRRA